MNKNKNKIKVTFVGTNSEDVTGSMTLIEFKDKKILLEAGLFQSGSPIDEYKTNSRKLPFKPSEIDYIFIGHVHIDHTGMIPRLYNMGCTAKIIAPQYTSVLLKPMIKNAIRCMIDNCHIVKKEHGINTKRIYEEEDIFTMLDSIEEYQYNDVITLDDDISFKFIPSGHVPASAQIELYLNNNNHVRKILYTGDLGNINLYKPYVTKFEKCEKTHLVIGETTYVNIDKYIGQKYRDKDLEKISSIIKNVISKRGKVLIPTFSFDRLQFIATILYLLFHEDETFDTKICIDTPLGKDLCKAYSKILIGEDAELWKKVLSWKKIVFTDSSKDSFMAQSSKTPLIALSSSGFMDAGRSKEWAKYIIPSSNNHIIFIGYSNKNSLAYKIKNPKLYPKVKIDRGNYKNKCGITDIKSFSSHMQKQDLLDYYSSIQCEKIALVHGEFKSKCIFAKELQDRIFKINNTSKVVPVNKDTVIYL